ncbi:MAG: alkaline phosphatase family protein, partial [Chloroflexota bacterium]
MPFIRLARPVRATALLAMLWAMAAPGPAAQVSLRPVASAATTSSSLPTYDHVFLIVMENHDESGTGGIIGSPDAPYINALAGEYGLATNYFGVGHPSLPNYLALGGGSTFGVTADCDPKALCGSVQFPLPSSTPNIADLVEGAGKSWKAYQESMATSTTGCFGVSGNGSTPNVYVPRHNPFVYFDDIQSNVARCRAHIAPYSALGSRTGGDLASDATTPAFAFITPNLCHDMHDDCSASLGTNAVQTGDAWLKQEVPKIFGSDAFARHNSLLVITWDESRTSSPNHVATIFAAPTASPHYASNATYNHYSLLHSIEQALGVGALTANDAGATTMGEFIGTPSGPSALSFPIRGGFYYPWFPETMTGTPNPFSYYSPSLGQYYDSSDPVVLSSHIRAMQYGGINVGIASWWGPNGQNSSKTDYRFPLLLREAKLRNFNWAIYYEKGQLTTDPVAIAADLAYIKANYATDPNYLKIGGRPVIFVYSTALSATACDLTSAWRTANQDPAVGNGSPYFYVVLKVFGGYESCNPQPDDWHQYNPDSRSSAGAPYWFSVSPGFWLAMETDPRLPRDVNDVSSGNGAYYTAVRNMVAASSSHWHLITTFNEWGEGHSVESASPPNTSVNSHCTASTTVLAHPCSWNTASGYGAYLDILHNNPDVTATSALASIQVAPGTASITAGGSQAFTATGFDAAANSLGDVTSSTTFSIAPNGSCTGNVCTATAAGAQTVTGNDGGHTATATLTVGAGAFDHIGLAPATATITAGAARSYTASAFDQYGNSLGDVTAATTFGITPN